MDFSTWTDEQLRERNEALGAAKLALRVERDAAIAAFDERKADLVAERTAIAEEQARRATATPPVLSELPEPVLYDEESTAEDHASDA